jgi:hypothetical protein
MVAGQKVAMIQIIFKSNIFKKTTKNMKISDSQMFQKTKVQDQWLCPPLRWAQESPIEILAAPQKLGRPMTLPSMTC